MKIFALTVISLLALLGLYACGGAEENGPAQPPPTTLTDPIDTGAADPIVTATAESGPAPCYPSRPETDEIEAPFADSDLALQQIRLYNSDLPPSISFYDTTGVGRYYWLNRRAVAEKSDLPLDRLRQLRNLGFIGTAEDRYNGLGYHVNAAFKMQDPAPDIDWAFMPASLDVTIFFFKSTICAHNYAQSEFADWEHLDPSPTAPESVVAGFYWRGQETRPVSGDTAIETTTKVAVLLDQVSPGAVILEIRNRFQAWQLLKLDEDLRGGTPKQIEILKALSNPDTLDPQSLAEALARRYEQTAGLVFRE